MRKYGYMSNPNGYEAMCDEQLQGLFVQYRITAARRVDEHGEHFYFDRKHAIEALINLDAGQRQTRFGATRSGGLDQLQASEKDEQTVQAAARRKVVIPILESKRWTPGKWATSAGVGKNSVYEYLDGRRKLSDKNRKAMAEELGLRPEELPE